MKLTASSILLILALAACNTNEKSSQPPPADSSAMASSTSGNYLSQEAVNDFVQQSPAITLSGIEAKPFDSIHFDKVIAYDFDGSDSAGSGIIDQNGRFATTIKKQQILNAGQIAAITSCLGSKSSYGAGTAPCFRPGMAIIFYQNDKPAMTVDICLDCNFLESSVRIPAKYGSSMLKDGAEVELSGFSKAGRECIISLAKQTGFSYASEKIDY
jgi:hypothetical protein